MKNVIACINLFIKYSRCTGSGVPANTPKPYASPKGIQGEQG
ncbi:MAG: hypothetical protein ACP5N5_00930 [Desulfurococcus sp.]